jgi:hypothetical protein
MERQLGLAFRAMDREPCRPDREVAPPPGPPQELDCFLATTDYQGKEVTVGDFRDRPLLVKTHRALLHLKHRWGRRHPFGPAAAGGGADRSVLATGVLAQMARATSAFPVAFEPVVLRGSEVGDRFAHMGRYLEQDQSAVFVDGGVLDNKPFTPVLPVIYERHADRPVERLLFFVEPDPPVGEEVGGAPASGPAPASTPPNFFQVALASLSTLPGYESISEDLQALDAHNRRLDLLNGVFGGPYGGFERGDPFAADDRRWCPKPPKVQRHVYHRARLHQLLEQAASQISQDLLDRIEEEVGGDSTPRGGERFARFFKAFCDRVVVGLGSTNPRLRIGDGPPRTPGRVGRGALPRSRSTTSMSPSPSAPTTTGSTPSSPTSRSSSRASRSPAARPA